MALSETIEKMLRPYTPLLAVTWKGGVRSVIVVITTIWLFNGTYLKKKLQQTLYFGHGER